jgi:hypothetical protein
MGILVKEFGEREGHKNRFYAGALMKIGLLIISFARR